MFDILRARTCCFSTLENYDSYLAYLVFHGLNLHMLISYPGNRTELPFPIYLIIHVDHCVLFKQGAINKLCFHSVQLQLLTLQLTPDYRGLFSTLKAHICGDI